MKHPMKRLKIIWLKIQIRYYKWRVARKQKQMWKKHKKLMTQLAKDVGTILEEQHPYE